MLRAADTVVGGRRARTLLTRHGRVSARSVETYTEALGEAAALPPLAATAPGPQVETLFLEADATMVGFDDGWHEVKTVVCWGRRGTEELPPRYLATEGPWEAMGVAIYQLARRQGLRRARAAGYPIGSGRIESACSHVVQQRLKLAGIPWDHRHAMAVLAARCADINGDWDAAYHQARAKLAA